MRHLLHAMTGALVARTATASGILAVGRTERVSVDSGGARGHAALPVGTEGGVVEFPADAGKLATA